MVVLLNQTEFILCHRYSCRKDTGMYLVSWICSKQKCNSNYLYAEKCTRHPWTVAPPLLRVSSPLNICNLAPKPFLFSTPLLLPQREWCIISWSSQNSTGIFFNFWKVIILITLSKFTTCIVWLLNFVTLI